MAQLAPPTRMPANRPRAHMPVPPQVQAKLDVGPAGDHFEQEADQVAAAVMAGSAAPATIPPTITPIGAQRAPAPPKKEEKEKSGAKPKTAQRKAAAPAAGPKREEEKKKPAAKGATAQRKAAAAPPKREEKKPAAKGKTAQREAFAGAEGGMAPDSVDTAIQSMRAGPASGLDSGTRSFMEGQFGRDFGDVRVHHGSEAAKAADSIGARAFTTGNDIFFNAGQYQPGSSGGRSLIAHELTHTVQQSGSGGTAARRRIQRKEKGPATPKAADPNAPKPTSFESKKLKKAMIETAGYSPLEGRITLPSLRLPKVANGLKGTAGKTCKPVAADKFTVPVAGEQAFELKPTGARDENSKAYMVWTEHVREKKQAGIKDKIGKMIGKAKNPASIKEKGESVYYLTYASTRKADRANIFIGTVDELAGNEGIVRPQWNPAGESLVGFGKTLDADHMLELQLGGLDGAENMWLLKGEFNQRVGRKIKENIYADLGILQQEVASETVPLNKKPKNAKEMKYSWLIRFLSVKEGEDFGSSTDEYWTLDQIGSGEHLAKLKVMNEADLIAAGLKLEAGQRPTEIKLFPSPGGGMMRKVKLADDGTSIAAPGWLYKNMFAISGTYFHTDKLDSAGGKLMQLRVAINKGETEGKAKGKGKGKGAAKGAIETKEGDIEVLRTPRLGIAGYIPRESIVKAVGQQNMPSASPLTFTDMGISPEGELVGTGQLVTSKALFPSMPVPVVLRGDEVRIDFPLPIESFKFGPFEVTQMGLGLGAGDGGIFVDGYAAFKLGNAGTGAIVGKVDTSGPMLLGSFDLTTDFLSKSSVDVSYALATDELKAKGTLAVAKGKIPLVEAGEVTVEISRETTKIDGAVTLGAPLEDVVLKVAYSKEKGLTIGAENVRLPVDRYPAIKDATASFSATRKPEGGWSFGGSGTATIAVPGVTGTIGISYLDGAITFTSHAAIAKGPATGTLDFTATNRALDETGTPVDGPPTGTLTVWGKGSVTARFGKVLTGTASVELTPDNRVIITGEVALPPTFKVFEQIPFNKEVLVVSPPKFPIWGISLFGYGIGIFGYIKASIGFESWVGPATIKDAKAKAAFDLDKPEDAVVIGTGTFDLPAYAGLRLEIGGGISADLLLAYARGEVGVGGTLGVNVGVSAPFTIKWNRAEGLSFGADLIAQATPQFKAYVYGKAEIGIKYVGSEEFGPWHHQLGEFGSGITLGAKLPVKWSEAGGLDLSLDKIEVQRPRFNAGKMMKDAFKQVIA